VKVERGYTVPAKQVRFVLQVGERLGISQSSLLAAGALDHKPLVNPEQPIAVEHLYRMHHSLAQLSDNPDIGLFIGRSAYLNLVDVLLYLSSICGCLRQWLKMMPSVLEVYGDLGKAVIIKQGDSLRSEWCPLVELAVSGRYTIDMALCIASTILGSICLQPVVITKAQFTYPQPNDLTFLKQCFGDNLSFDQEHSALHFDAACLDFALIQANSDNPIDDNNPWQQYINNVAGDDFLFTLRQSIACALPTGEMSIDGVAQELGISRRTLQRRLSERVTNFQDIVQDLRSQMALYFLADNKMDVTSIAFVLGYSDSSSFSSAFKTWHGSAPSKYTT